MLEKSSTIFSCMRLLFVCSLEDVAAEKSETPSSMPKTYCSPWEQEILSDPKLAEALKMGMTADPRPDLPEYKCFNR